MHGFDAVVTISNQFVPPSGDHPIEVDRRKLQRVALHHLSWVALLTEAVIEHEHRGVSDPDQAWILGELIAYLEHPNSGAMEFEDMGPHWTGVRDSARDGTLRGQDEGVADVLTRWDEFSRFLSLHLGRELGADVQQVLSRADRRDMAGRRGRLTRALVDGGTLECTLRVPAAEADIDLGADLKMRAISASLYSDAPSEGRPRTRVNWVVRQLRSAPDDVRIDTYFEGRRTTSSNLLGQLAAESGTALLEDRRVVPRGFNVTLAREMGLKRGSGRGSFVESVSTLLETFYGTVAQDLEAWPPRAPRLPEHVDEAEPDSEQEEPSLPAPPPETTPTPERTSPSGSFRE